MGNILPIELDSLLYCSGTESERVEFKASWDPDRTGPQVLRTVCAFANDYHNLNGGYVVIGVGERDGRAALPPKGLSPKDLAAAQKWIRGNCKRLEPPYPPILSPEVVDGRDLLVVWAPASEMRPHRAPGRGGQPKRYWVRLGAETVDAEQHGELLQGLIQQTARVPWDDRRAHECRPGDLSSALVREYLRNVRSGLLDEPDDLRVYRHMRLTVRVNDHEMPRNVGLLLFSKNPTEWIRGAKIEVVQFAADRAGDVQEERVFDGSLIDQLRDCLRYLDNLSVSHLQKQPSRPEARGWVSYPSTALRETLVNAAYHRGYDLDQPEPTKVYLYPSRVEIISYPGPVPGIEAEHLLPNAKVRAAPARNRRIGEYLKELKLAEGRLTGLPKVFGAMEANGSPAPQFDFDPQRTYFQATLPAHPEYAALSAVRDAAHLRAVGLDEDAFRRIESSWRGNQGSALLGAELLREYVVRGEAVRAEEILAAVESQGSGEAARLVKNAFVKALIEVGDEQRAREVLNQVPTQNFGRLDIDMAILAKRARDFRLAHRLFESASEDVRVDPRALLEFAQTKIWLAQESHRNQQTSLNRQFLSEARTLLERVLQLQASSARHAWAWRELARTRNWLREPLQEVEAAYRNAIALLPSESRFGQELESVLADRG